MRDALSNFRCHVPLYWPFLPHRRIVICHSWIVTLYLSLLNCHFWLATLNLPLLTCHAWTVTLNMSWHFSIVLFRVTCYSWLVNLSACWFWHVTLDISLLTCNSCHIHQSGFISKSVLRWEIRMLIIGGRQKNFKDPIFSSWDMSGTKIQIL